MNQTQEPTKLREYEKLWLTIAEADCDVIVTCPKARVKTLIQAVRKEKTAANTRRRMLDLPRYGKLTNQIKPVENNPRYVQIVFHLLYNGDKL